MNTRSPYLVALGWLFLLQTQTVWTQQTTLPRKTLAETLGVQVQEQVADPLTSNPVPPTGGALVLKEQKVEFPAAVEQSADQSSCSVSQDKCSKCKKKCGGCHSGKGGGVYLNVNYIHSQWNDLSPVLDNGSLGLEFGILRNLSDSFEGGLGMGWFSGVPNTASGQSQYYAFYVNAKSNWLILDSKFTPTLGLDLNLGSYKVWAVDAESDANITFSKAGSGALIGLTPRAGVRFQISEYSNFDVQTGYHAYINTPQEKLGGWMAGISLSLIR
jgi:hypothetical protein